jgi:uncharacterized membrane protein
MKKETVSRWIYLNTISFLLLGLLEEFLAVRSHWYNNYSYWPVLLIFFSVLFIGFWGRTVQLGWLWVLSFAIGASVNLCVDYYVPQPILWTWLDIVGLALALVSVFVKLKECDN